EWNDEVKSQTIDDLYEAKGLGKPFRYGESFVFKSYDVKDLPSDEILDNDLEEIIDIYKITMGKIDSISNPPVIRSFQLDEFSKVLNASNLQFNSCIVKRFVSSLTTKPFVILTGLSGSGKTKLAQSF